jgi:hypothetical protein
VTSLDMTESIAPKSDQLNAEDLLSGPRTFTIADVKRGSAEQPVDVHLVEFPGRPFKPSKTVRRLMVNAWGPDAASYVGKRMTLYRDPAVKFGGMDVGGIRVSHMSHLSKPMTVALTVTRGKRAPFVVQPLVDAVTLPAPAVSTVSPDAITRDQVIALGEAMTNGLELAERDAKLKWLTEQLGRPIKSPTELTQAEGDRLIKQIRDWTEPTEDELTLPVEES